jgi:hypothetical protein
MRIFSSQKERQERDGGSEDWRLESTVLSEIPQQSAIAPTPFVGRGLFGRNKMLGITTFRFRWACRQIWRDDRRVVRVSRSAAGARL